MNERAIRGFKAFSAQSYVSLEGAARIHRCRLFPEIQPFDPLPAGEELLRRISVSVGDGSDTRNLPVSYDVADLPVGTEGLTRFEKEPDRLLLTLSATAYKGLERADPRAKFSALHELGHLVLHRRELIGLAAIPHREAAFYRNSQPDHEIYFDTEWQCDTFAAAMLVPAQGLAALQRSGQVLTSDLIASRFGISAQAAQTRLVRYNERKAALDQA